MSCRDMHAAAGMEMCLRLWAPVDSGTISCIGSIIDTVLQKSMMFIRRAASPGMI